MGRVTPAAGASLLHAAAEDRLLHLGDRARDLDAARARIRAVERRAAAPHALAVVEDVEAHLRRLVARVEDEPVRVHDRRGAEVLADTINCADAIQRNMNESAMNQIDLTLGRFRGTTFWLALAVR